MARNLNNNLLLNTCILDIALEPKFNNTKHVIITTITRPLKFYRYMAHRVYAFETQIKQDDQRNLILVSLK